MTVVGNLRVKDGKSEASLGYTARSCNKEMYFLFYITWKPSHNIDHLIIFIHIDFFCNLIYENLIRNSQNHHIY